MNNCLKMNIKFFVLAAFIFFTASGATKIADFDQYAYRNATELKARTMLIIDRASEPYQDHKDNIQDLEVGLLSAYEYAKSLPDNQLTSKQWWILIDPEGDLWGKFHAKWKKDEKLSPYFAKQFKKQTSAGFDAIICLEINKKEPTKCENKGE